MNYPSSPLLDKVPINVFPIPDKSSHPCFPHYCLHSTLFWHLCALSFSCNYMSLCLGLLSSSIDLHVSSSSTGLLFTHMP